MPKRTDPPRARNGDPDWQRDGNNLPLREHSEFWRVGGFVWHVQRCGTGPSALLLHGTGAGTFSWAPLVQHLRGTFETVSVDLPGHGFTQAPADFRPTLSNVCDALMGLLTEMEGKPQLVVGHSAGAAIALNLAAKKQIDPRLIVSINGALQPFDGLMKFIAPVTAKAATFGGLAARMVARNASTEARIRVLVENTGSEPNRLSIGPYTTMMRRRGHIQGTLRMMANWDLSDMMRLCERVQPPVLFLAGQNDKAVPTSVSERAAGRVPRGTYLELKELGHLAHEENPGIIAEAIVEYWDRASAENE